MLLSVFFIFILRNPIYSLLNLIVLFLLSGFVLLSFELEFLGFAFVMVYVGAITVLFLFVLMMICTKKEIEKKHSFFFYLNFVFFINFLNYLMDGLIKSCFYYEQKTTFFDISNKIAVFDLLYKPLIKFDHAYNLEKIGQILFNYYGIPVLTAGIILLVALIGCIALTLDFKKDITSRDEILPRTNNINKFF
jgi:NADH-quinone oxidoreductase subunit J